MSVQPFRVLLPKAARRALEDLFYITRSMPFFIGLIFLGCFTISSLCQPLLTGDMDAFNIMGICIITLVEMVMSFLFLLVIPPRLKQHRNHKALVGPWKLIQTYSSDMAAEMLRVAAGVLIGILMLAVPGLIRTIKWIFVPFVVNTDEQYASGQRDALEYSAKLSHGLLWLLGFLWLLFLFLDLGLSQADQGWWKMQGPESAVGWAGSLIINFVSLLFALYSTLINYELYELRHHEEK